MTVIPHHTADELCALYRKERDTRLAKRLHAVWLARCGLSCPQIMAVTGSGRRSIQQWVAKYNAGGVEELADKPRSGRPPLLTPEQQHQLKARVEAGPAPQDIVSVFNAPIIGQIAEREFGVRYSPRGIQYVLGRLGFSYKCPRPRHEKSDPEAQEAFKKNSRPRWPTSPRSTPANILPSTSKTKPASASKAP